MLSAASFSSAETTMITKHSLKAPIQATFAGAVTLLPLPFQVRATIAQQQRWGPPVLVSPSGLRSRTCNVHVRYWQLRAGMSAKHSTTTFFYCHQQGSQAVTSTQAHRRWVLAAATSQENCGALWSAVRHSVGRVCFGAAAVT